MEAALDKDEETQKYIADHYVAVWIDDKKDDGFAAKHHISSQGYPNVPIWDANGELVARVIGFGGMDSWTPQVKAAADVSGKLCEAKEKAAKDAAANGDYAKLLAGIPDREQDALDAFGKIPADKKDAAAAAAENGLRGKMTWNELNKKLNADFGAAIKDVDRKDKAAVTATWKKFAPTALPQIDAWLSKYGDTESASAALYTKTIFCVRSGDRDGAEATAKTLTEKFPQSREAKAVPKLIESMGPKPADGGGEKK